MYVTTARHCKYIDSKAHQYFSKVHEVKVSKTATVNENKNLSKSLLSLQGIPWMKFPVCSTLLGSVRDKIIRQADIIWAGYVVPVVVRFRIVYNFKLFYRTHPPKILKQNCNTVKKYKDEEMHFNSISGCFSDKTRFLIKIGTIMVNTFSNSIQAVSLTDRYMIVLQQLSVMKQWFFICFNKSFFFSWKRSYFSIKIPMGKKKL